jgi:hypothetical protein
LRRVVGFALAGLGLGPGPRCRRHQIRVSVR